MRILLFGEYSGLHTYLAQGLKELGHDVTTVGDGNMFHDFPRDINIRRGNSLLSGVSHLARMVYLLPKFSKYDIVQLINPDCFGLKAERERYFYQYLRKHNKKIVVGAFGCDWYWVDDGLHHKTFRYGDFYIGEKMRHDEATRFFINEYANTPKGNYTQYVMNDADFIPTCLYEYQASYSRYFPNKTQFIPLPFIAHDDAPCHSFDGKAIHFFIGIDRKRSVYKGTDIMLKALEHTANKHPGCCHITKVESLPYKEYEKSMNNCDIMLDQLYSYTPSMNSLLAMSKGIVVVGGGEPENYEIIHERQLRPIINVEPTFESVCAQLEWLIQNKDQINRLKRESILYVKKHHDYQAVARQYETMYNKLLERG